MSPSTKKFIQNGKVVNVNVYTQPAVCMAWLPLYMLCIHAAYQLVDVLRRLTVCILVVNKTEQMQERQTQTLPG